MLTLASRSMKLRFMKMEKTVEVNTGTLKEKIPIIHLSEEQLVLSLEFSGEGDSIHET